MQLHTALYTKGNAVQICISNSGEANCELLYSIPLPLPNQVIENINQV